MTHPKTAQEILDDMAHDLTKPTDETTDCLLVIGIAGAEEAVEVTLATGESHTTHGIGLRMGSVLMVDGQAGDDKMPMTTVHNFFIPPTAIAECVIMMTDWVKYYLTNHASEDVVYGHQVVDLLRAVMDSDEDE